MKNSIDKPDFLVELEKLQEKITALQERIHLVDENQSQVRPKIYEKVKAEYLQKLQDLNTELQPFCEIIKNHVVTLQKEIDEHIQFAESYQEEIEELQLRYYAHEYSEQEYQPKYEELKTQFEEIQVKIAEQSGQLAIFRNQLGKIHRMMGIEMESEADDSESLTTTDYVSPDHPASFTTSSESSQDHIQMLEESDERPVAEVEMIQTPEEDAAFESDFNDHAEFEANRAELHELEELEAEEEPGYRSKFSTTDDIQEEIEEIDEYDTSHKLNEIPPHLIKETVDENDETGIPHIDLPDEEEDYIWASIPILDVIEGDFTGESYPMDKDRITIGRGPNNDIQLATDTSVSRHHAQLTRENSRYILIDLESSNGTSVNGMRVTRTILRPNDEIMIGQSKLVIRPSHD